MTHKLFINLTIEATRTPSSETSPTRLISQGLELPSTTGTRLATSYQPVHSCVTNKSVRESRGSTLRRCATTYLSSGRKNTFSNPCHTVHRRDFHGDEAFNKKEIKTPLYATLELEGAWHAFTTRVHAGFLSYADANLVILRLWIATCALLPLGVVFGPEVAWTSAQLLLDVSALLIFVFITVKDEVARAFAVLALLAWARCSPLVLLLAGSSIIEAWVLGAIFSYIVMTACKHMGFIITPPQDPTPDVPAPALDVAVVPESTIPISVTPAAPKPERWFPDWMYSDQPHDEKYFARLRNIPVEPYAFSNRRVPDRRTVKDCVPRSYVDPAGFAAELDAFLDASAAKTAAVLRAKHAKTAALEDCATERREWDLAVSVLKTHTKTVAYLTKELGANHPRTVIYRNDLVVQTERIREARDRTRHAVAKANDQILRGEFSGDDVNLYKFVSTPDYPRLKGDLTPNWWDI